MPDETVQIVPYQDTYAPVFARLNREWLEAFGLFEALDGLYLDDPRGRILDKGGEIFVALLDGKAVGTCAAIPSGDGIVELAKLAVAAEARGRGLGEKLVLSVVDFARQRGARRVVLSSSTKLAPALRLYKKLGFHPVAPGEGVGYATADVFMALSL
ncbi:MAG: GNAT family N-acetyltransferase [Acidobacteriota bacterium]